MWMWSIFRRMARACSPPATGLHSLPQQQPKKERRAEERGDHPHRELSRGNDGPGGDVADDQKRAAEDRRRRQQQTVSGPEQYATDVRRHHADESDGAARRHHPAHTNTHTALSDPQLVPRPPPRRPTRTHRRQSRRTTRTYSIDLVAPCFLASCLGNSSSPRRGGRPHRATKANIQCERTATVDDLRSRTCCHSREDHGRAIRQ